MNLSGFEFYYGWRKMFLSHFQGKDKEVPLVVEALEGELVTQQQEISYQDFIVKQSDYEKSALVLVEDFIKKNEINNPVIDLTSILIQRNGTLAFLCYCSWAEDDGIAIVLGLKQYIVGQDDFL